MDHARDPSGARARRESARRQIRIGCAWRGSRLLTLYVDSSALLKRYVEEADSLRAHEILTSDPVLVTGRHTIIEIRRNLALLLRGNALDQARTAFTSDVTSFAIVELDAHTCELAATIAEQTGVRSLDALHLGAAQRVGGGAITFATFDLRQAQAARSLGLTVVGA